MSAKIKLNERTIKNLLRAWLLRPNLGRADDYICCGITLAVSSYLSEQAIRNVHVYEAEVRMLWCVCCHLAVVDNPDLLYNENKFYRRAIRWMLKDYPDEMRPFLGEEMIYYFQNFSRSVRKLQAQRVSQNHPRQSDYDCCADYFSSFYNKKGDPESAAALEECVYKALEHAASY